MRERSVFSCGRSAGAHSMLSSELQRRRCSLKKVFLSKRVVWRQRHTTFLLLSAAFGLENSDIMFSAPSWTFEKSVDT